MHHRKFSKNECRALLLGRKILFWWYPEDGLAMWELAEKTLVVLPERKMNVNQYELAAGKASGSRWGDGSDYLPLLSTYWTTYRAPCPVFGLLRGILLDMCEFSRELASWSGRRNTSPVRRDRGNWASSCASWYVEEDCEKRKPVPSILN